MIADDHPIPPFHPYLRKYLPQIALDLDRAEWHINNGGLSGVRLPIYASAAAEGPVDMASILQDYGSRMGLNLAVNRMPAFISLLHGYDGRLKGLSPTPPGGFMGYIFAEHVWWQGRVPRSATPIYRI